MYQQHPASISQEGISFKPSNLQSEHLDCIKLMRLGFLSLRTSSSHIGWDTMMLQIQGWPTQHWAERSAFFWRSKRCTRWTSAGNDRWRGVGEYAHHFPKFFMWCIMAHYGALWRIMAHYGAFQIVCFPFFRARMRVTAWIKTTLPGFCS